MVAAASVTASPLRSVVREGDIRAFKLWSSLVAPPPPASSPPLANPAAANRQDDRGRQLLVDLGDVVDSISPGDASRGGRVGGTGDRGGGGPRGQGERSSLVPLASVLSPSFALSFALDALRLEVVGGGDNSEPGHHEGVRDWGRFEAGESSGIIGCEGDSGSCLPLSKGSAHSAGGGGVGDGGGFDGNSGGGDGGDVGGGGGGNDNGVGGGGSGGEEETGRRTDGTGKAEFVERLGERRRRCLRRDGVLSAVVEIKDVRVEAKKTPADGDMDTEKVSSRFDYGYGCCCCWLIIASVRRPFRRFTNRSIGTSIIPRATPFFPSRWSIVLSFYRFSRWWRPPRTEKALPVVSVTTVHHSASQSPIPILDEANSTCGASNVCFIGENPTFSAPAV